jgi:16S rRNA (guanine1207-N2)-methyltransferase
MQYHIDHLENYDNYYETLVTLSGLQIKVFSKPGLRFPNLTFPSEKLLSEHLQPLSNEQIILFHCGNGALATFLGVQFPTCAISISDIDFLALNCAKRTIKSNGALNATIETRPSLLPDQEGVFDTAIFISGKGRKLARRRLVEIYHLLKSNGKFYLAGSNNLGIHSIIKDAAALFELQPKILGYKKGHRAVVFIKKSTSSLPTWINEPGIAPGSWHTFPAMLGERTFPIYSLPGVFSYNQIDEGTKLLLESLPQDLCGHILDMGCGYGIIGLSVAANVSDEGKNESRIDLVDSNLFAIISAEKTISANLNNLGTNTICAMQTIWSDLMSDLDNQTYDVVLTNPPFHAGKIVDYTVPHALIQQAHRVLKKKGRLILVANRFIRYEKIIANYFESVNITQQTSKYHVITAQNPK